MLSFPPPVHVQQERKKADGEANAIDGGKEQTMSDTYMTFVVATYSALLAGGILLVAQIHLDRRRNRRVSRDALLRKAMSAFYGISSEAVGWLEKGRLPGDVAATMAPRLESSLALRRAQLPAGIYEALAGLCCEATEGHDYHSDGEEARKRWEALRDWTLDQCGGRIE